MLAGIVGVDPNFVLFVLFMLAGIAGVYPNFGFGITEHVLWYQNIGMLLSIGGCAASAIAAIIILRNRPRGLTEPR